MDQEILFKIKPEFVVKKNLLLNFLIWLPISVASGVEAVIIYLSLAKVLLVESSIISLIFVPVTFAVLTFLVILGFLNEKLNYEATDYTVYPNRIEFSEGFLNSDVTTIMIADIKELHLKRSLVQKKGDIGTIRFVTACNSTRPFSSTIHSTGINFRDIKNSVEIYAELKKLVEAKKR